jgi:membrane protease YdiL (CAAX protease family)
VNLSTSPDVPWSVVVAAVLLYLGWQYAAGIRGPLSKRPARRRYLRGPALSRARFAQALLAGSLALGTLIALWLVLTEMFMVPSRRVDLSAYPRLTVLSVVIMASIVGAVTEEAGLRGYLLKRLEGLVPAPLAIVIAAILIAPGHALTQGFVVPVVVWYLAADVAFGTLAYLCGSIVPVIVIHAIGLLLFFSIIWPTDPSRRGVTLGTADTGFWLAVLACAILSGLTFAVFARLREARGGPTPEVG